ncbi:Transposon TX1 uncharacterized 149 kDa protein ORF 2 [Takifugu flavidus]|uniref:Transposon TX1 uncharacterized 149 kDa protein ORF 2 n=1 Tax=Takifugu flavidus TaxID=433684 RepID=A0A5C6NW03_9TELE|nr:Transposon TX1 uncharacterized 149 kDa protein ORF 2 [Takifugu flavidus]
MLCQQHTLNVTRHITGFIRDLETEIVELERLNESTGNGGSVGFLKSKKMALANLLGARAQDTLVWSRIQNISEMDAPSSFFFSLERKSGQKKLIHAFLSHTGQELTNPGQIKAFWDILAQDVLEVFNKSLATGSLPLSCRRAVITLLPKKGNLQNWHPVSLLCKILSG